jgi:hypothetical protein
VVPTICSPAAGAPLISSTDGGAGLPAHAVDRSMLHSDLPDDLAFGGGHPVAVTCGADNGTRSGGGVQQRVDVDDDDLT